MTRRRRPSTTPDGRGPPPHGFATGRIGNGSSPPQSGHQSKRRCAPTTSDAAPTDSNTGADSDGQRSGLQQRRHDPHEIGRASCRERVCQYVKISAVAVALQKQKISNTCTKTHQNKLAHKTEKT